MNYEGVLQDEAGNSFYPKTRYAHIKMKGALQSGISFNDIVNLADSSAYRVNAEYYGTYNLPGYPTGAYRYGTLITINPGQSTEQLWDIVQIYVPDDPANYGIYFRTHLDRKWVRLSGETVAPTS